MASGKQIAEFSSKLITITYSPGPGGSVIIQMNLEGTATGFGAVLSTVTCVGGVKGGTFSSCGVAYLENGDSLSGIGQGTYESIGKQRWHTKDFTQLSDGSRLAGEGEVDMAQRSWKGKLFEMN